MTSKRQKEKGWLLPEELTGHPLICVQFQIPDVREYRSAVRGAIQELTKRWNWQWEGKGDFRPRDVAQIFRTLIDETLEFNEECSGHNDQSGCIELPLDSPAIEWLPMDPFRNPDEIPSGYLLPPWYRQYPFPPSIIGAAPGDVVTDPARFAVIPTFEPLAGFARFRLALKGTGTVELHFVNLTQGGYAQVQVDGDIFQLSYVDLNKDPSAVPAEREEVIIVERTITEPGDHFIDVTMIPVFDLAEIPIRYGGAIRKIVLCGFDEMHECEDCPDCEDCPEPCGDDCDELEDFLEDFCFDDLPELEDYMYYAAPFVGQLVAGVVPPTSGGWLLCNGSPVNKADFPELYAILLGKVGEDETTFNLPDFTDRIPIGAGTIAPVLETAGNDHVTLAADNLPPHEHSVGAHTHTTEEHNHTQDAHTHIQDSHTHNQDAHNHTQNSHLHTASDSGHSHNMPVRDTSATGAQDFVTSSNNSGTGGTTPTGTGNAAITIGNTTATNNPTTASNQHAVAVNRNTTATNQPSTVTVNPSEAYTTGSVGDSESFPIIPPVIGVNWFIFAGSGKECC